MGRGPSVLPALTTLLQRARPGTTAGRWSPRALDSHGRFQEAGWGLVWGCWGVHSLLGGFRLFLHACPPSAAFWSPFLCAIGQLGPPSPQGSSRFLWPGPAHSPLCNGDASWPLWWAAGDLKAVSPTIATGFPHVPLPCPLLQHMSPHPGRPLKLCCRPSPQCRTPQRTPLATRAGGGCPPSPPHSSRAHHTQATTRAAVATGTWPPVHVSSGSVLRTTWHRDACGRGDDGERGSGSGAAASLPAPGRRCGNGRGVLSERWTGLLSLAELCLQVTHAARRPGFSTPAGVQPPPPPTRAPSPLHKALRPLAAVTPAPRDRHLLVCVALPLWNLIQPAALCDRAPSPSALTCSRPSVPQRGSALRPRFSAHLWTRRRAVPVWLL